MQWFTRDCLTGGLSDAEWQARCDEYAAHLEQLVPRLRFGAELLHHESLNLMHAIPNEWGLEGREFWMRLVIGDLQDGYEWALVTYHNATLIPDTAVSDLERWPLTKREIEQDELEPGTA